MTRKFERGYASVENEEYRKGYRDGWRDAMNEERLDKSEPNYPPMKPTPYVPGTPWTTPHNWNEFRVCSICGMVLGPYHNCYKDNCPMQPHTVYKTKTTDNTSGK